MLDLLLQPWTLLTASGAMLICAGLLVLVLSSQVRELRRRDVARESAIEALRDELRACARPPVRAPDERQLRLEREFDELRSRQQRLEMQALEAHAYQQAVDWVRRGANTDQLVKKLGLSHGEAELVRALHRAENLR